MYTFHKTNTLRLPFPLFTCLFFLFYLSSFEFHFWSCRRRSNKKDVREWLHWIKIPKGKIIFEIMNERMNRITKNWIKSKRKNQNTKKKMLRFWCGWLFPYASNIYVEKWRRVRKQKFRFSAKIWNVLLRRLAANSFDDGKITSEIRTIGQMHSNHDCVYTYTTIFACALRFSLSQRNVFVCIGATTTLHRQRKIELDFSARCVRVRCYRSAWASLSTVSKNG